MTVEVRIVAGGRFGAECADAFLELLRGFATAVVGLATGTTPVPMYEELRRRASAGTVDLSGVRSFAIDEYVAPRGHPCSNHAFFDRYWSPIPGAGPVEEFDPEAFDLDTEARRFAGALHAAGGLDVVVLGIGMNGHIAFNEPGSARDSTARVVDLAETTREAVRTCWGAEPPARGLTLGLRELLGARRVLLLASGERKAGIVQRALDGPVDPECPASFLQEHPQVTVVLDGPAANSLRRTN